MELYLREFDKELVQELKAAMTAIQIPDNARGKDPYIPRREEFSELIGLTQEEILDSDIYPLIKYCPNGEEGHSIRVALRGMPVSHMLGFDPDERVEYFLTGTAHDLGKLKVQDYYPEKNPHIIKSEDYFRFLDRFKHGHVNLNNIPYNWGIRVASAIEGTHFYQNGTSNNGAYPRELVLPQTPESILLSKLIAIPDFIDAVSSRPCKKTGKYFASDEIVDLTIREYGNLRINYRGNIYTKVDTSGKEIIQELQKRGFIGREKPINISEAEFRMNPLRGLEIK
jgi:hypothetical protein